MWVHVVGVCGITTAGVAVMFKNLGHDVTGSDQGFFPPVSTYLEKNGITILGGYNASRLTNSDGKHPDLVVIQGTKGDKNPEVIEAVRLNLKTQNYADVLRDYVLVKDKSIVIAGTYGKTTISALLVTILRRAGKKFSHMVAGVTEAFPALVVARDDASEFSVIEGDEYLVAIDRRQSKFFLYDPTILLINAVEWEHTDLFPTVQDYIANFEKLIRTLPKDGLLIVNSLSKNAVQVSKSAPCRVIYYAYKHEQGLEEAEWYRLPTNPLPTIVNQPKNGKIEIIPYTTNLIGEYNHENILAAVTVAGELGVTKERIQEALSEFPGIRRRLEIRYQNKSVKIIDDFGSSPPKAKGSLLTLREEFPDSKILAIFEPNSGNRTNISLPNYANVFSEADQVFLPRFTHLPKTEKSSEYFSEMDLGEKIASEGLEVEVLLSDDDLLLAIKKFADRNEKTVVVFMGSHGFRGMIDKAIALVTKPS